MFLSSLKRQKNRHASHQGNISRPVPDAGQIPTFSATGVVDVFPSTSPLLLVVRPKLVIGRYRTRCRVRDLVVAGNLAVVADELEAADNLADGEEAEALGEDDTTGDELGSAEAADLLDDVLGRDGAALESRPEVLVGGLESGHGTVRCNR